jgi:hypothetical protein
MKKDAFYFPHFANARHDRKIRRMEKELGLESYAIYFKLLEILREQIDFRYPTDDLDLLADEIGTSEQKVRVVICNYELFTIDEDNKFFSIKQIYYLQPYIEKTSRARLAAQKRWDKMSDDANAMQMHMQMQSKCNADAMQVKESKVKESKVKESIKGFVRPELFEVQNYFEEIGNLQEADGFFNYYESNGWKVGKNPMKDWKAASRNWIKNSKNYKRNDTTKSSIDHYNERRENLYKIAAIIDAERGIRP